MLYDDLMSLLIKVNQLLYQNMTYKLQHSSAFAKKLQLKMPYFSAF